MTHETSILTYGWACIVQLDANVDSQLSLGSHNWQLACQPRLNYWQSRPNGCLTNKNENTLNKSKELAI